VAATVRLADAAAASYLRAGDRVDVLAAAADPQAGALSGDPAPGPGDETRASSDQPGAVTVVARAVTVLATGPGPSSPSAAGTSDAAGVLLLGVRPDEARALAGAQSVARLSVVIVPP
jgi:Flp pilus assembly protein CpaB